MSNPWIVIYLDLEYNEATGAFMSRTEGDLEIASWLASREYMSCFVEGISVFPAQPVVADIYSSVEPGEMNFAHLNLWLLKVNWK